MKNKTKNILLAILVIALSYGVYDYITSKDKEYKKTLDEKELENKIIKDSINKLVLKTIDLSNKVKENEVVVDSIEKGEETAKKEVEKWKYSYTQLVKAIPKDVRDSLTNYKEREFSLLEENKSVTKALVFCDSAKIVQSVIITDLKEIISTKDIIDGQKDRMLSNQGEMIGILKQEVKHSRWKGRKEGSVFGVVITVLAVLLI